jgi:hypothetical protein
VRLRTRGLTYIEQPAAAPGIQLPARSIPRLKRLSITSLCPCGGGVQYVVGRSRPEAPDFPGDCHCGSLAQHGAQFLGRPPGTGRSRDH